MDIKENKLEEEKMPDKNHLSVDHSLNLGRSNSKRFSMGEDKIKGLLDHQKEFELLENSLKKEKEIIEYDAMSINVKKSSKSTNCKSTKLTGYKLYIQPSPTQKIDHRQTFFQTENHLGPGFTRRKSKSISQEKSPRLRNNDNPELIKSVNKAFADSKLKKNGADYLVNKQEFQQYIKQKKEESSLPENINIINMNLVVKKGIINESKISMDTEIKEQNNNYNIHNNLDNTQKSNVSSTVFYDFSKHSQEVESSLRPKKRLSLNLEAEIVGEELPKKIDKVKDDKQTDKVDEDKAESTENK